MDNRPIGVFDSGLGGLTAMRELIRTLPNENILLLRRYRPRALRLARARNHPQIRKARYEFSHPGHDVKAVLAACGTVSSVAP